MYKKYGLIFFLLILFFFIILVRTVGLFNNNILFLFDSARDFLYVKKIIIEHKPILIGPASGGLQGYFQGVLWYYLLAIPFAISGGNPISGTWLMAIMSAFSVLAAFFILKKIMNIYAAILGTILLGFSDYSIATAKFIWNPYPIVWLMSFYFWGIYLICKQSRWGIYLLSVVQALILHFEVIYGLGILPAYLFLLFFDIRRIKNLAKKIRQFLMALIIVLIPMLPSLVFDIRHQFLISKSLIQTLSSGGGNLVHKSDETQNDFGKRIKLRFSDLITYSIKSFSTNNYLNYFIFGVLTFGAIIIAKKKKKELVLTFLLTSAVLVSPFLFFLLLKYSVWGNYWIGSAPLYAMFVSFFVGYLTKFYSKQIMFIILLSLLIIITKPWETLSYWHKGNLNGGPQTFSTQLSVVRAIYKDANNKPFSAYEQTPPVYDYVYRYLFWWQGSTIYHFIPTDTKQKIVYVILENVREDPQATYFKKHTLHLNTDPVKIFSFGNYPIIEKFITNDQEMPVEASFFPQL